jgi:hypothetical protein
MRATPQLPTPAGKARSAPPRKGMRENANSRLSGCFWTCDPPIFRHTFPFPHNQLDRSGFLHPPGGGIGRCFVVASPIRLAEPRSLVIRDAATRFLVWASGKIGAVEGRVERPEVTLEQ